MRAKRAKWNSTNNKVGLLAPVIGSPEIEEAPWLPDLVWTVSFFLLRFLGYLLHLKDRSVLVLAVFTGCSETNLVKSCPWKPFPATSAPEGAAFSRVQYFQVAGRTQHKKWPPRFSKLDWVLCTNVDHRDVKLGQNSEKNISVRAESSLLFYMLCFWKSKNGCWIEWSEDSKVYYKESKIKNRSILV